VDPLRDLDDRLFYTINALARRTDWLHSPVVQYATHGVVLFALLLLSGVFLARIRDSRTLAAAGWAGIATLLALAVNQPLTHVFNEARPYVTHPTVLLLVARSPDSSFPSDHAVMAGAAATGLLLANRRLGLIAAVAAVLMAFSRVYVAAHYPWDVAAGLAVGAGVAGFGWLLLRVPLIAATAWLRRQPGVRTGFAPTREWPPAGTGIHARA